MALQQQHAPGRHLNPPPHYKSAHRRCPEDCQGVRLLAAGLLGRQGLAAQVDAPEGGWQLSKELVQTSERFLQTRTW